MDYFADVWLNGEYLGHHEGMFNPFEFDVTDRVDLDGDNVVAVKDGAPRDETEYVQVDLSENPLSVPYRTHQAKAISPYQRPHDRRDAPTWVDDVVPLGRQLGGIWESVELIARPHVYVDHLKIFTKIGIKKDWLGDKLDKPDGTALVSVDVTVHNATGEVVETDLKLIVEPKTFDGERHERTRAVALQPGHTTHKLVLTVPDARLWWTWDKGIPTSTRRP